MKSKAIKSINKNVKDYHCYKDSMKNFLNSTLEAVTMKQNK